MYKRNPMHSRLRLELQDSEPGSPADARRTPCGGPVDLRLRTPMNGPFRALKSGRGFISLVAAIALLYYGRLFLMTVCTAIIINFILEPFVGLLTRVRVPRALASLMVCAAAVCAVYFAALGVCRQGATLVQDVPKYAQRIGDLSDRVRTTLDGMEQSVYGLVEPKRSTQAAQKNAPERTRSTPEPLQPAPLAPGVQEVHIRPERSPIAEFIHSHLDSLSNTLLMASFVPFLVYFMLSWRDHTRPAFLQLFEGSGRIRAATSLDGIASMVRAFVVGNFLLGLLMAVASTVFFAVFRLPYPILIGPLSGFLSLVPSIGLPLALIPPLVAALPVYGSPAAYLIIVGVVALFHLLGMNVLYPKIVGPRVHLNPLVVSLALMFWSALWGAAGLILAIPLTAGIKAVCDNVKTLERYARLLGD
jgi:predicted PurR-regulated permease PerM